MAGTEAPGHNPFTAERAPASARSAGDWSFDPGAGSPSDPRGTLLDEPAEAKIDEIDRVRAQEYGLLALVLGRAPNADVLARLAEIRGDASPLGLAHIGLAQAAAAVDAGAVQREYFDLFVGIGRGELLPYASYYQTGFLHERPLAALREDLASIGIARAGHLNEPEDHIAILCECMAGLAGGRFPADAAMQRRFFERHLKPWEARFFADLETARPARFYRAVAVVGRVFLEIEAEAFAMDA